MAIPGVLCFSPQIPKTYMRTSLLELEQMRKKDPGSLRWSKQ